MVPRGTISGVRRKQAGSRRVGVRGRWAAIQGNRVGIFAGFLTKLPFYLLKSATRLLGRD